MLCVASNACTASVVEICSSVNPWTIVPIFLPGGQTGFDDTGRFSQKVEGYEATLVSMLNARAASLQGFKVKRHVFY